MGIHILWDSEAPAGIELPVIRMIAMILGEEAELVEYPLLIDGYDRDRNQHDAQKDPGPPAGHPDAQV